MTSYMVMDVESIGLHGEGFAVAWVVVDATGNRLAEACYSCDPALCHGLDDDRDWVLKNVSSLPITHDSPREMRDAFWADWLEWKAKGAQLAADCLWPVESGFISACVAQDKEARNWEGPYPFHELASVLAAKGHDPLAITERLPDELPSNHPLMDARQSARRLVEAVKGMQKANCKVGSRVMGALANKDFDW